MRNRIPTNTDSDGCAVCIKSNYFKMGSRNFKPQVGGGSMLPLESWRLFMNEIIVAGMMPNENWFNSARVVIHPDGVAPCLTSVGGGITL
jgi:hypothetical protein